MAEHALYNNNAEAHFPFDRMRAQLSWLPAYLSASISDRDFDEPLLNTVLVFTRARTAALLHMGNWHKVLLLANRLNAAAVAIRASHHKLELVPYRGMFFVTCRRSPRFQWKLPMTHRDIGRNLDYFAPGHIATDPDAKRCNIYFIEKRRLRVVTGEVVLLEYLQNDSVRDELQKYNDTRINLFNHAMQQLGLNYEFKCIVITPTELELVALTMADPCPPPPRWWEENCYFVNGTLFPGVLADPKFDFCGYETKYDRYWPLIQLTFFFVLGYKRYEYCDVSGLAALTYSESMEILFRRIKSICAQDRVEDYNDVFAEIEECLGSLAESTGKQSNPESESDFSTHYSRKPISLWQRRILYLKQRCRSTARLVYIHTFERFKLRQRMVRESLAYPPAGDEVVFC